MVMRLRVKWCFNTNGYMLSHSASLFSRYLILYAPTALSALHYRYHHAHIKPSWVIVLYGCAQSISIYRAHYECDIFSSPFQNVGSKLRKNERCVIDNRAKKMKGWHIFKKGTVFWAGNPISGVEYAWLSTMCSDNLWCNLRGPSVCNRRTFC